MSCTAYLLHSFSVHGIVDLQVWDNAARSESLNVALQGTQPQPEPSSTTQPTPSPSRIKL